MGADEHERFSGNAAAPVRLAEPVADLGRVPLDIGADDIPDRAGRFAVHFDREIGRIRGGDLEKCLRVGARVRVGKSIAQLRVRRWRCSRGGPRRRRRPSATIAPRNVCLLVASYALARQQIRLLACR